MNSLVIKIIIGKFNHSLRHADCFSYSRVWYGFHFFSTLSVFISYIFAFFFWKDLNKIENQNVAHYWFKAGLLLNVFSSIGTFGLAFMMANKIADQTWYLAAVYFYLHFQYNGWFFFTCMGLFYVILPTKIIATNKLKRIFWLFALASVPAYFYQRCGCHCLCGFIFWSC